MVTQASNSYGISNTALNKYLGGQGIATDTASVSKLWSGAFGSFGTSYSGTAAQNAALLHAMQTGYKSNVNNGSISGSSSIKSGQNTDTAMASGSKAIGGGTPPPSSNSNTIPANNPAPAPTAPLPANPILAGYQTSLTQATQMYNDQQIATLAPMQTQLASDLQVLQNQQQDAIAGAKATYAAANPNGFGSDEQEFIDSVTTPFDTQIQNAKDAYNSQALQVTQQTQDNIYNAQQTYQANVSAYYASQQSQLQYTMTNNPPAPISGNADPSTLSGQSNLMKWADDNSDFMTLAFSTGNYGSEYNDDGSLNTTAYLKAAAQLSQPNKTDIEEETSEENANSNASKAGSAAESAGAAKENATTNANNANSSTTTVKSTPGLLGTSTSTSTSYKGNSYQVKQLTLLGGTANSDGTYTMPDGTIVDPNQ